MSTFAENRKLALPVVFQGPNGRRWAEAVGSAQDGEAALLRLAGLLRSVGRSPDDALGDLGSAFGIERYAADTDESYRARLIGAFDTWSIAGSKGAVELQLTAFGVEAVVYDSTNISLPFFSAFEVWITPNGAFGIVSLTLGSWTLGSSSLGASVSNDVLTSIKRIILKWKAAHGYPIMIRINDGSADPPTTFFPVGRTLGVTWATLGDAKCILGGYDV